MRGSAFVFYFLVFVVTIYIFKFFFLFRFAVHGGWSKWSNWTECSVTCGSGVVTRDRHCNNPEPAAGGKHCNGTNKERKSCRAEGQCIGKSQLITGRKELKT